MIINPNLLERGYLKYKNEYDKAVLNVLESGWYILGKEVERFENKFKEYIGSSYCVGLNSGLDALILALRSLDIKSGDEVIVPANTYIASVLAITENGATPIFIEPDEFYNIDVNKIEDAITERTKAILVVHLYGQAANMKKIKETSVKHNLFLIEDCAQSHGAKFDNKMTGTWGDVGCFSFYPTKNIGAFGDAGAIVTDNEEIYGKIHMLRNYGSKIKYQNELLGVNSRLDELQAAILNVKLSHYNELKVERIKLAELYLSKINNPKVTMPTIRIGAETVWHLFVVQTNNRDGFQEYLKSNGIGTQIHYPIPPHLSKAYEYLGFKKGDFTITEKFAETLISLPLYDCMTYEEIMYVIEKINRY
jgi:dTDP-4-amino-4,6-dideoxygalactose transaminase